MYETKLKGHDGMALQVFAFLAGLHRKFDQRSEVCRHLLANPTHRFNFKQPEILGSIVG